MKYTSIGLAGLEVSAIGLGCLPMSEQFGPAAPAESHAALRRAVEVGMTHFDTSDAYGINHASETLLGDFLKHCHRDEAVVATKFGVLRAPGTGEVTGLRATPDHVRSACEASLKRLGTDRIDLYYLHVPDPETPIEDTVGAMAELVANGKVRHLGLSNVDATALRAAHAVHPITALQDEWSVFSRGIENELAPVCAELGIGVVAHSPLSRGFLSGAYTSRDDLPVDDCRQLLPRYAAENSAHNTGLLDVIDDIGARHRASTAQVALAWLTHRSTRWGTTVVPIPGTKRGDSIEDNARAADVELSENDLQRLDELAGQVHGSPLPEMA